ncbi:hypothetical protein BGX23_001500 [Mortierella sp. AD031]|nr:hypothetical protein BGX23_001500 [Mortierella sp. AD031]
MGLERVLLHTLLRILVLGEPVPRQFLDPRYVLVGEGVEARNVRARQPFLLPDPPGEKILETTDAVVLATWMAKHECIVAVVVVIDHVVPVAVVFEHDRDFDWDVGQARLSLGD